MKFKSLIAAGLTLAMLAGCSNGDAEGQTDAGTEGGGEQATTEAKTYNVGVAIYDFNDAFMTLYRNEIESYFATLETDEVKYKISMVDGKNDQNEQGNQIDTFIAQQMDVVILNLVQTSSADSAIQKLVDAGIPVVLINREPMGDNGDESYAGILDNATVCYVGADARQSGTIQGQIIVDLENHGDVNGDGVVKYIMVQGDPENSDAQYRTEFSIKALEDAGIKVENLYDKPQVGNWKRDQGQTIAANALAQFGEDIEVIFCNNDDMACGAATSIENAGRKVGEDIYLVGVDAIQDAVDLIQQGKMTGTVLNDHVGQSHKAVDVAVQLLNGEAIDNYYWVDYLPVTE